MVKVEKALRREMNIDLHELIRSDTPCVYTNAWIRNVDVNMLTYVYMFHTHRYTMSQSRINTCVGTHACIDEQIYINCMYIYRRKDGCVHMSVLEYWVRYVSMLLKSSQYVHMNASNACTCICA